MKRNILILLFGIIAFTASAQTDKRSPQISIFPNPATEYIRLSDDESVRSVSISNMLGRKIRTFDVSKADHYDIADLPNGLYLIQIIGKNNKVLTTQRLTKKS
jgi:Secretion system C-terminal sorting domain